MTDKSELLKKLLLLAEQGVGGEAENAKRMAEDIAKKYNVDLNEYEKIWLPKLNSSKRDIMDIAATMCGSMFAKKGHNWFLLGKHNALALDCYYYLCGLIPKEHRKDAAYIHGFAMGLRERLKDELGWVDGQKEVKLMVEALDVNLKAGRKVSASSKGYDHAKEVSLHRQADSKTKLLSSK